MCDYIVSWKCQNTSQWLLTVLFKNFQNKAGQLFAIDTNSSVFTCGFSLDCTNFHILAHSMVWSIACSCKKPPRHNCLLTFTIIYSFSFEEILLFHNNRMLNFTSILLMFSIWEEKLRRYESSRWCKFLYSLFIHEMLNFEFEWKLFDLGKVFLNHRAQSYTYCYSS